MSDVLKDVWVMRTPLGHVIDITEFESTNGAPLQFGWTVTRETLLTPEQAAVIAAAKDYADLLLRYEYGDDVSDHNDDLIAAVRALRAQDEV